MGIRLLELPGTLGLPWYTRLPGLPGHRARLPGLPGNRARLPGLPEHRARARLPRLPGNRARLPGLPGHRARARLPRLPGHRARLPRLPTACLGTEPDCQGCLDTEPDCQGCLDTEPDCQGCLLLAWAQSQTAKAIYCLPGHRARVHQTSWAQSRASWAQSQTARASWVQSQTAMAARAQSQTAKAACLLLARAAWVHQTARYIRLPGQPGNPESLMCPQTVYSRQQRKLCTTIVTGSQGLTQGLMTIFLLYELNELFT